MNFSDKNWNRTRHANQSTQGVRGNERRDSFSVMNASSMEAKFTYIKLNSQPPSAFAQATA
jgi:hypothetical protein